MPHQALRGIAETKPNLAIIDISLNAASGLELVKDLCIRHPLVASLVLSMHEEDLYAERAMRAGARGYVRKRETSKNILTAIRCVLEGGIYISQKLSNAMAQKFLGGARGSWHCAIASRTVERPGVGGLSVVRPRKIDITNCRTTAHQLEDRSSLLRSGEGKARFNDGEGTRS